MESNFRPGGYAYSGESVIQALASLTVPFPPDIRGLGRLYSEHWVY